MEVEISQKYVDNEERIRDFTVDKAAEQKKVLKTLLDLFLETNAVEDHLDIEDNIPVMSQQLVERIEDFLEQLARCYQSYGCPTHAIEINMAKVAKGLGLDANFMVFPSHMVFEISNVKTDAGLYRRHSQFFRTSFGYNYYKLQLVDELARTISSYAMDVDSSQLKLNNGLNEQAVDDAFERARAYSEALSSQLDSSMRVEDPVCTAPPAATEPSPTYSTPGDYNTSSPPTPTQTTGSGKSVHPPFQQLLQSLRRRLHRKGKRGPHSSALAKTILELARVGPNIYTVSHEHMGDEEEGGKAGVLGTKHRAQTYRNLFSRLAVEDGVALIRAISKQKALYPEYLKSLLLGTAAFGCCGLFFGGSWTDMWISLLLGVLVARIELISNYSPSFSRIFEFSATFLVSIIVRTISYRWRTVCYRAIVMSTMVFSLQGVTITLSFIDLMTRDLISGTTRLFYGLLVSAMIGFAMELSTSTYASIVGQSYDDILSASNCSADRTIDPNWYPLIFLVTTLSFNLLIETHKSQLLAMEFISACCFVVYYYTASAVTSQLPVILAAFTAAALSNVYSRITGQPAIVYTIPAVFLLVPGSIAVSSFYTVLTLNLRDGANLTFSVVTGALAVAIGLFAASTIVQVPDIEEFFHKTDALYPGPRSDNSKHGKRQTHRNSGLILG